MKVFPTGLTESLKTATIRIGFNWFPAYRRGGGRVCFISSNWQEIQVKVSLGWSTKNIVGTVFGGSLYATVDPLFMFQLIKILGNDYIVWDRSASIKFIKPVKHTVCARFIIDDGLISNIKKQVQENGKFVFDLPVDLVDKQGEIYVSVIKQMYVASKDYYKNRQKK